MGAAEVVMHEMQSNRVSMVFCPLAESVGQAGEATHTRADGQLLALNVTGADLIRVGLAKDRLSLRNSAFSLSIFCMSLCYDNETIFSFDSQFLFEARFHEVLLHSKNCRAASVRDRLLSDRRAVRFSCQCGGALRSVADIQARRSGTHNDLCKQIRWKGHIF